MYLHGMAVYVCRKKAISRAGGIALLVAVLAGGSAEGSMHAAQTLLHMAKLPDLKVGSRLHICIQSHIYTIMHNHMY